MKHTHNTTDTVQETAEQSVADLVTRARLAQASYATYTQQQIDEVVLGVAWTLIEPAQNRRLAEQAVADTGLGNVEDKIRKNHRKTIGLLRDLMRVKTVGVVNEIPEKGLVEIARPIGVIGAVVPSTNPIATPYNKILNALKCGNAIILAPSPKGQSVCSAIVAAIHSTLTMLGAPCDLVQMLPTPVNKLTTQALMQQVDLILVTGSQNNVKAAYHSGTPAIGVGAGNVPSIIDTSADCHDAAAKIMASKTFDNATSCSSENSIIILDAIYDTMLHALAKVGGYLLDQTEKQQLQQVLWDQHGHLSRDIIAKSATRIVELAQLTRPLLQEARCLLVSETGWGKDYPFSDEKLSPILTVYHARDFEHACEIAQGILTFKGQGHSISIHSQNEANITYLGQHLPVCRVIVNQAHCFATGGFFNNGLPFSLSMGCGSWGGNTIYDNLHYRHYLNITRIARTITPDEPSVVDLFSAYWQAHAIQPEGV